jgi:hypothetical protein
MSNDNNTTVSMELLMRQIEELKAENNKLKAKSFRGFSIKISEKGAVSVYGLQRFPVTLYASAWETLIAHADDIKAFLEANKASLARKETKAA